MGEQRGGGTRGRFDGETDGRVEGQVWMGQTEGRSDEGRDVWMGVVEGRLDGGPQSHRNVVVQL